MPFTFLIKLVESLDFRLLKVFRHWSEQNFLSLRPKNSEPHSGHFLFMAHDIRIRKEMNLTNISGVFMTISDRCSYLSYPSLSQFVSNYLSEFPCQSPTFGFLKFLHRSYKVWHPGKIFLLDSLSYNRTHHGSVQLRWHNEQLLQMHIV